MTDAVKAAGQHMQQEPAHELVLAEDHGFVAVTFVGCHARTNGTRINLNQDLLPGSDVIDELVKGGAYYCKREGEDNTSKSTFIYCYAEGDQPNIRLTPDSSNYNWTPLPNTEIHGPGTVVIGGEIVMDLDKVRALPPAYLQSDGYATFPFGVRGLSSNGLVEGLLGGAGDYTAFQFLLSNGTVTDFTHYQLSYNDSTWNGWWQIHPKAFPADPSFQFSTGLSENVSPGEVWLRKGYYIGDDSNRLKIATADSRPADGTGKLGDQVWNSKPTPGSHIGWVCTKEADQATKWYPFGKIEI